MVPTEQITEERLGRWKRQLNEAHATPVVLVAVGHDHNSGRLVLYTVEDVSDEQLAAFLRYVLSALQP